MGKRGGTPATVLLKLYLAAAGLCGICGRPVDPDDASRDHITPLALGGADVPENWQLAHLRCNVRKGTSHLESLAIGNPKTNPWRRPPGRPVKITAAQVREIRHLYVDAGWSQREIARRYQIGQATVWNIINGRRRQKVV